MKTLIYIEHFGLMCNQLLLWAKVREMFDRIGAEYIVASNTMLGRISLPRTTIIQESGRRIADQFLVVKCDSVVRGEKNKLVDAWNFKFDATKSREYLKKIKFPKDVEDSVDALDLSSHIGVHVRYGDFVWAKKEWTWPYNMLCRALPRYYLREIENRSARKIFLATDALPEEVEWLTEKHNAKQGMNNDPIFDLLALSRCEFIIGSGGSTFSSTAAELGGCGICYPTKDDYV